MRKIHVDEIITSVQDLAIRSNTDLGQDVLNAFGRSLETEASETGKQVLGHLIDNAKIARREGLPICQDTGMAVVFVDVGQDVHIVGGSLKEAIHEGVRRGYDVGFLRKSVCHPLTRQNTGDNTPAIIHFDFISGDRFKIVLAPKGFGSENMSRVTMLAPSQGLAGVKHYVLKRVKAAGPNPCPPTTIGVGIGGTIEWAAFLAKKALLRPLGSIHPDPQVAVIEQEWLTEINKLGIGPQGLGGRTTSLAVHINTAPCHIASIPVAVNIQCHAARHKEIEL